MSEIRETTTIDDLEVAPSEPLISLGELLAGVGFLAYQTTRLAVKGAWFTGKLAYQGGRALANEIATARANRLAVSQIAPLVNSAGNTRQALNALAAADGFEIPKLEAEKLKTRIESLVAANDKQGITALATELTRSRQERLRTSLLKLTAEACGEIGFSAQALRAEHGVLVAKSADGRRKITVAVDKTKEGDVKLHFDADGFHGGACIEALDALQARLTAKGVRFRLESRKRKDGRPAFDGRRLPLPTQAHIAH
jgi:hypothetical protein